MDEFNKSGNVTYLLEGWVKGDVGALAKLIPEIYDELRRMAEAQLRKVPRGGTLNAPGLISELYERLSEVRPVVFENRSRFFALAALMMRGLLIDQIRARQAKKRGGNVKVITLSDMAVAAGIQTDADVLDVAVALDELCEIDRKQAQIVDMRFFGGLSIEETSDALGISAATVSREFALARAWLKLRLKRQARVRGEDRCWTGTKSVHGT